MFAAGSLFVEPAAAAAAVDIAWTVAGSEEFVSWMFCSACCVVSSWSDSIEREAPVDLKNFSV